MKKAAFVGGSESGIARVFDAERRARLSGSVDLFPEVVTPETFAAQASELREVEAIFSTWGMFRFSPEQFALMPGLRAVFYAAGSVRGFAGPFLERGVLVVSAWAANATPVAEFTLAQILLANKGYWRNLREYREGDFAGAFRGRGNFGAAVSLLGAGQIGRGVIGLLRSFRLQVQVFDPYLSREAAAGLGVEKVELDEAFARGAVVSNHLANLPATVGLLTGRHFASMPKDATFINTGRGATVLHDELLAVLEARPDLTALLDVTTPEPLPADSPFRSLPNVHITTHIAGSMDDELARLAETMIEEFEAWQAGRPLRHAVSKKMLETMA